MKSKKLKGFVLPTIYIMVISILFISISFLAKNIGTNTEYPNMSVSTLDTKTTPVIKNEDNILQSSIERPYVSSNVSISKTFYDMTDDAKKQEESLVYYQNTYLQNSGVLYESNEAFDIKASYDGKITNVAEDDILGKYVEITHNSNLKTVYYCLSEVIINKDDVVISGDVIGKSGNCKLSTESKNSLLFEVYYNGYAIDPEDFYNMNIENLK